MSKFIVILRYEGAADDRFDRDYYVNSHTPRALETWNPCGLLSERAFFPAAPAEGKGTVCMAELIFEDAASFKAALAAPGSAALFADVANFTDLSPSLSVLSPLPMA